MIQQKIISYDTGLFDFAHVVQMLYSACFAYPITDLSLIHQELANAKKTYDVFNEYTDQSSMFHKLFYQHMDEAFLPLYETFVRTFVRPRYQEKIVYQKKPTFRAHLPDNLSVGAYHRDRDYNHAPTEQNYWVPLTSAFGTNTLWVESEEDKGDFMPQELNYGQLLIFNGANLRHGNKINTTGKTRVSFDFRVVPFSQFIDSNQKTITAGTTLTIGDYFDICD